MSNSIVTGARLIDVLGRPRTSGEICFVPVLLEFDAPDCELEFALNDRMARRRRPATEWALPDGWQALWVRARLPRLFQFAPLLCANNWQPLINIAFLAVCSLDAMPTTAHPFVCRQAYDPRDTLQEEPRIGLSFCASGPPADVKSEIADSFWSLLEADVDDLAPFTDCYYHESGGYFEVGFERRGFYFEQNRGAEDADDDGAVPTIPGWIASCSDCDGTGIEDQFPFTEDCATCGGTGIEG